MKKKNLSKLIGLAVLLEGLSYSSSVLASFYGTPTGGYTTTQPATSCNMTLDITLSDEIPHDLTFYGGHSFDDSADGNTANIEYNGTNGIFVYGGLADSANNNTVNISGTGTYSDVFGGFASNSSGTGGVANGNTINISGGYFTGKISAGRGLGGESQNNVINISGGTFGEHLVIDVGHANGSPYIQTGNKLILNNWKINAESVEANKYDFIIGDNISNGDVIIDTIDSLQIDYKQIGIALNGNLDKFAKGEYVTLFSNIVPSSYPLSGSVVNIYTDVIGGTPYTGEYKYALENGKLLFGDFLGDYYVCDNSSGSEELVYESESFRSSYYTDACGNVDSSGNINTKYSNNVVHVLRGSFTATNGIVWGLIGGINSVDTIPVKDNIVYIDGKSKITGSFAGGYSTAGADVTGNMIVVNYDTSDFWSSTYGADSLGDLYGGWSYGNGNAGGDSYEFGNKVLITTAKFSAYVSVITGGYASHGNANFNSVEIGLNDGEITGKINVFGGRSYSSNGEANNNKVILYSGVYKEVDGGRGQYGYANENYVQVSGEIQEKLYGGRGMLQANSNEVYIAESTFGNDCLVYGGYVEGSNVGTANDNTVEISESTTTGNLTVYGGYSKTGSATGNQVTVLSGDFSTGTVKIIGGGTTDNTKETNNNIVDIAGGTFGSNVSLIGGQGTSTGNKLEYRVSGQTFNSVRDFQEMNFYLPTDTDVTGAIPLMTVTNEVTVDAVVNVYNPNNIALTDGDIVTLIHDTSSNKFQDTFTEMQGGNVLGQTMNISGTKFVNQYAELGFDDDTNPTKLQMKVQSAPEVTTDEDVLKAPVEGMAAAAHAVNTVSDLASTQGMENMTNVTANSETAESFAASNIGKQKLKSGSHVDVHGYALVAGVAKKTTNDNGDKVTTGLFFEYGNNDFDTYQDNGYHGEGSSVSRGGGLMWKYESVNGSYYEGMLHAGRVKTNWKSNELNGGYETNSIYYGGAATYGYKLMMEEREQLKFYASYMYGHTADSDVNVGGADYHFYSVKSHRTRLGVRYIHSDLMEQNKVRPYIGFAWEHEFDGEARADVSVGTSSISAPAPTMKGNTGIMDIGCTWDTGRWTVSLGGEMYVGKRRGWNGMLSLTLNF